MICSERKTLVACCWLLVCFKRKVQIERAEENIGKRLTVDALSCHPISFFYPHSVVERTAKQTTSPSVILVAASIRPRSRS
jgi:hypothetical protein